MGGSIDTGDVVAWVVILIATMVAVGLAYLQVREDTSYKEGPSRRACSDLCDTSGTELHPADFDMCVISCVERMRAE